MTDRSTDHLDDMDLLDLLDFPEGDRLRAAGEVAPPRPAVVRAALAAVRAAGAEERTPAPEAVPLRPRRPARRTRRLVVSAAAIAAIAAGVSVYPVSGMPGSPPAATASAADFLRGVAATEAAETATDAPYWRTHTRDADWGDHHTMTLFSEEPAVGDGTTWLSSDAIFSQQGGDGEIFKVIGFKPRWVHSLPGAPREDLSWDELKRLPSDAAALKEVLEEFFPGGLGPDPESEAYSSYISTLTRLLSSAPLGPGQRAAVYEVLADVPGLQLVGPVQDSTGRTGTAVEKYTRTARMRIIIDPRTGGLLEQTFYFRGGKFDGKPAKRSTILSAGPQQTIPPYTERLPKGSEPTPAPSTPAP
ncbi:CU044_5270 family protein [Streptomyces sp. NPDC051815]|uniref:CU044_5270 family protein n=1 Tax=Streptomyces sp. NPDC051815 TaxID=3365674 RepID=UPI00379C4788